MLAFDPDRWPELHRWARQHDWSWLDALPEDLREPALFVTYYVLELARSGPLSGLAVRGVADPEGRIVDALRVRGCLTVEMRSGVGRWTRASRA